MIQFPINNQGFSAIRGQIVPQQIGPQPNPNANSIVGGNNQQQVQSQLQQQQQQQQPRQQGQRRQRDADWDICWDFLSPKGCNRETCRWRHGQRMYLLNIKY